MPAQPKYGWLTKEILDELYHGHVMSAEKVAAALRMPTSSVLHYMDQLEMRRRTQIQAYRAHLTFVHRYGTEWVGAAQEIGDQVLREHGCWPGPRLRH